MPDPEEVGRGADGAVRTGLYDAAAGGGARCQAPGPVGKISPDFINSMILLLSASEPVAFHASFMNDRLTAASLFLFNEKYVPCGVETLHSSNPSNTALFISCLEKHLPVG